MSDTVDPGAFDEPLLISQFEKRLHKLCLSHVSHVSWGGTSLSDKHIYQILIPHDDVENPREFIDIFNDYNVDIDKKENSPNNKYGFVLTWEHNYTDEFEQFIETVEECLEMFENGTLDIEETKPNDSVFVRGYYEAQQYPEPMIADEVDEITDSIELSGHDVMGKNIHSGIITFHVEMDTS